MLPNSVVLALFAMGLAAALALFVSLKYEMRVEARKDRARMDAVLQRLDNAERSAPAPPAPAPEPVVLRSGMNLSRRTQALRLLRRGENISHVAAAVGVSRREIELLMHVQKVTAARAAGAGH